MQTIFKHFFSCLFYTALTILSGCGNGDGFSVEAVPKLTPAEQAETDKYITEYGDGFSIEAVPKLTPAEQAETDKYITEYGRDAILYYLKDEAEKLHAQKAVDTKLILKYIKHFVSQGADINAKRNRDMFVPVDLTPLIAAVVFNDFAIVEFLVSQGADVNTEVKGEFGNVATPLDVAQNIGNDDKIVKYLISKGAIAVGTEKRNNAFAYIKTLDTAIQLYDIDIGQPPTNEQWLEALVIAPPNLPNSARWGGPYIEVFTSSIDPWGNEYQYRTPGYNGRKFDIWSYGPDGISGTDDDIGSWMNSP